LSSPKPGDGNNRQAGSEKSLGGGSDKDHGGGKQDKRGVRNERFSIFPNGPERETGDARVVNPGERKGNANLNVREKKREESEWNSRNQRTITGQKRGEKRRSFKRKGGKGKGK